MTDNDPLLSDEQIAALCPGLTQPARRLAFLHQRGFVRAYFRAGRVCLERVHYDAVCRGQFDSPSTSTAPTANPVFGGMTPADWYKANVSSLLLDVAALRERRTADIDSMDFPGVYILFQGDSVQYVGRATSVAGRLVQHVESWRAGHFDSWAAVECPVILLPMLERAYYDALRPSLNRRVPC